MTETLFSCRNCVQNPGQSLNLIPGEGFCLQFGSLIERPESTTCKYLHRKDLPSFVVEEGTREHAADFAFNSGMADLETKSNIEFIKYSEKFAWDNRRFHPLIHAIAQYHKSQKKWIFIQSFTSGVDGLRAMTHASLVRRYLQACGTWRSSYRLMLGLVQEINKDPLFDDSDLDLSFACDTAENVRKEALWDVVFTRLSGLQEYGWHAGIEDLAWLTDSLNGGLYDLNWKRLKEEITKILPRWTNMIVEHSKNNRIFFETVSEEEEFGEID